VRSGIEASAESARRDKQKRARCRQAIAEAGLAPRRGNGEPRPIARSQDIAIRSGDNIKRTAVSEGIGDHGNGAFGCRRNINVKERHEQQENQCARERPCAHCSSDRDLKCLDLNTANNGALIHSCRNGSLAEAIKENLRLQPILDRIMIEVPETEIVRRMRSQLMRRPQNRRALANGRSTTEGASIQGAEILDLRGGGSGIRTRDTVSRIHTFQACAFNHSATPPSLTGASDRVRARLPQGAPL
jgi:hypothetical protein